MCSVCKNKIMTTQHLLNCQSKYEELTRGHNCLDFETFTRLVKDTVITEETL